MFISENVEVMNEWNWSKNTQLGYDPNQMKTRSNKKVWWVCENGHEWQETIDKRTMGRKCPYCSNYRVYSGYNDLETKYPELCAEWNNEKNGDLTPKEIVFCGRNKVWWTCKKCGHEWRATPASRTVNGTGCPKCAKQKRTQARIQTYIEKNGSLADTPLAGEWNEEKNGELRPEQVTIQSNKAVWWKCSICGYEWKAKINNRSNGRGCPACSNKVVVKGRNDLATTNPELAKEWHPDKNKNLKATDVTAGCGKKVWWLCPKGHSYQATVLHRSYGTNCPICNSGRQTSFAEQAVFYYIKQIYPNAVNRCTDVIGNRMELDIYIPSIKTAIEYDGCFWHKEEKLERDRKKCSLCHEQGIRLIRIREKMPDNASDAIGLADSMISMENLDKVENLQNLIHILLDQLDPKSNMWTRKNPLYFHSQIDVDLQRDRFKILGYMQDVQHDSLAELRPELAEEWHPTKNETLRPTMFTLGSDKKVWWKCKVCGHEWEATISHRASGTGCPACYDLTRKTNHPENKKVFQYSLDGKFIREWPSISEAGRCLKINPANIGSCTRHQRYQTGGFRWESSYKKNLDDQMCFW